MATPRKTRGEYRPVYEALFHGKDFKALSPYAKLVLLTLKGLCGATGIKVWPAISESLSELTGVPTSSVKKAIGELTASGWIQYEDGIVWIVRGLEFEPQISEGEKHRTWFWNIVETLPRAPIVERFCAHYKPMFGDRVSKGKRYPIDIPCDTTTPSPTSSPSPSPSPTQSPASSGDERPTGADAQLLTIAANAGLDRRYANRNPMISSSGHAHAFAQAMRDAGVDVEFAAATIFAYASTMSKDEPPHSLKYFTRHVIERWEGEKAKRDAATYTPATAAPSTEVDQMRSFAIRYARDGSSEWQQYCDDRSIEWAEAVAA